MRVIPFLSLYHYITKQLILTPALFNFFQGPLDSTRRGAFDTIGRLNDHQFVISVYD